MSMLAVAKVSQILTINDDNIDWKLSSQTSTIFLFIQLGDTKTFFSIHNNDLWHRKIQDDIKPGNQNPPTTVLCCQEEDVLQKKLWCFTEINSLVSRYFVHKLVSIWERCRLYIFSNNIIGDN